MFYTRACFSLLVEALRRERSSVRPARAAATVIPSVMSSGPTTVIQVTNLSAAVTSDQMRTLFSFLGDVEELRLYPPDNAPLAFSSKVCYIRFREPSSVGVAQHLTNTVFIDRALIVVPCAEGKIPEESKALSLLAPVPSLSSLLPGAGLLPIPTPTPTPSPLASVLRRDKVDVPLTTTAEQLLEFFKQVGDVRFVRMAGDETQPTRFAFVEFSDQNSVTRALTFNGVMFGDRPLKINHSNNAIVKPPELTPQAAAKELEEVMKRVREAQSLISEAIEPEPAKSVERVLLQHSKSRSPSRSRSQSSWKRSHSKHRSRSHNRSRSRHKERRKSKSPHKKRSRSKERHRSKSRSRSREKKRDKEKSKAKEKERTKEKNDKRKKEKRSRSPSKGHSSVKRSRSVSREKRKRRSRSVSKSPRNSKTVKRVSRSPTPRRKRST
ncbi:splicing regulatory glutamine/lysine-rich protein 1 isoform X2 [Rana temporaria]|uniref:splicing regulatory glutamine/lysine-rich protein 1 isoform X2 n=1 Tax=Rana temporaria TaxID=8407 RepID=UPI001AAC67A9|nr:splicing regulatory glutamine/lysine-rich protein 1 isoform X2 [Rana temporaria]